MAKKIPLQNGKFAIVDDEDYERAKEYVWHVVYLRGRPLVYKKDGYLASFITNHSETKSRIEHRNKDYYDFRKNNLVHVPVAVALSKSKARSGSVSKYKGVTKRKRDNKWVAQIMVKGKGVYLGSFESEDEAALAYNIAALEHFGEQAYQNVIGIDNREISNKNTYVNNKQRRSHFKSKSGFKGVSKISSQKNGWQARISFNGRRYYLGAFGTPEQAAKSYDKKAYELYGDKAILNFPHLIKEYKKTK